MEKGLFNKISGFSSNSDGSDSTEVSRISRGVTIKGDISSVQDIRIDGCVDGIIYSKSRIVAGEAAILKGRVFCENLDLWGTVDGDVYVNGVLTLNSTAVINGNLNIRKLQVELGAKINGICKMIDETEYKKTLSSKVKLGTPETVQEETEEASVLAVPAEAEVSE